MKRFQRGVDHPLVSYLVIGSFSLLSAWICWRLGGSVAQVVTPDAGLGATIELGGAVGGFAAMFLLSLWVFRKLHQLRPATRSLRVFLTPREPFQTGSGYTCFVTLYDAESGDERRRELTPRRENGYLTLDLLGLRDGEMFQVEVRDGAKTWRSDYSPVAATRAEMLPV
jgi:hypothetical protein